MHPVSPIGQVLPSSYNVSVSLKTQLLEAPGLHDYLFLTEVSRCQICGEELKDIQFNYTTSESK